MKNCTKGSSLNNIIISTVDDLNHWCEARFSSLEQKINCVYADNNVLRSFRMWTFFLSNTTHILISSNLGYAVKLARCNGVNWDEFEAQFAEIAKFINWNVESQVAALINYLNGTAHLFLTNFDVSQQFHFIDSMTALHKSKFY